MYLLLVVIIMQLLQEEGNMYLLLVVIIMQLLQEEGNLCVIMVKECNDIAIKHIIVMYVDRQTLPYTRNFLQKQQFKMFYE